MVDLPKLHWIDFPTLDTFPMPLTCHACCSLGIFPYLIHMMESWASPIGRSTCPMLLLVISLKKASSHLQVKNQWRKWISHVPSHHDLLVEFQYTSSTRKSGEWKLSCQQDPSNVYHFARNYNKQ